jgi:hypothetical protein
MDRLLQFPAACVGGFADMTAQQSARLMRKINGPAIETNRLERSVP